MDSWETAVKKTVTDRCVLWNSSILLCAKVQIPPFFDPSIKGTASVVPDLKQIAGLQEVITNEDMMERVRRP